MHSWLLGSAPAELGFFIFLILTFYFLYFSKSQFQWNFPKKFQMEVSWVLQMRLPYWRTVRWRFLSRQVVLPQFWSSGTRFVPHHTFHKWFKDLLSLRLSQDLVWRGLSSECFWSVLLVWGRWVHQGTCLLFDRSRFWLSSFQAILLCRLEHLALLRPCFAPGNWRRQSKEGNWCFGIWRLIAVSSVWRWSRYRTWRKDWTRRFLKRHKAACQRKDW